MKRGWLVIVFGLILIMLSVSFVSANIFSDFWNKIFSKPQLSPGLIEESLGITLTPGSTGGHSFGGAILMGTSFRFETGNMYLKTLCVLMLLENPATKGDIIFDIRESTGGTYPAPVSTEIKPIITSTTLSKDLVTETKHKVYCVDFTPTLLTQGKDYFWTVKSLDSATNTYKLKDGGPWYWGRMARAYEGINSFKIGPSNLDFLFNITGVSEITPSCTDECSPSGSKVCVGNEWKLCGNYDDDSCLEWSSLDTCAAHTPFCSAGTCVACIITENCDDNNVCTTDTCTNNVCSNVNKKTEWCGARVCGPAPAPNEACSCGTCSSGENCAGGECFLIGGPSLFEFNTQGTYGIELKAPIKEGDAKINVLYGDETQFRWVAGDNDEASYLRTSNTNTIKFDRDIDDYFVVSDNVNKESYLLRVSSTSDVSGTNYTTIKNIVNGNMVSDRKKGEVITLGNAEITIGTINHWEKTVEMTINSAGSFRRIYDRNLNYLDLPIQSELPTSEYFFNIFNKNDNPIAKYKAYFLNGQALIEKITECVSKGYKCTSRVRGCGHYQEMPYACADEAIICCKEVPYCGDGVCFIHDTPGYGETLENCPQDCKTWTQECNGCDYQQVCAPFGFRKTEADVPKYCDLSKTFLEQKSVNENCFNNWECKSNTCADGKCVGLVEEIRAQTSLLWRILCTILHLWPTEESRASRCVCITGDSTRTSPEYLACLAG